MQILIAENGPPTDFRHLKISQQTCSVTTGDEYIKESSRDVVLNKIMMRKYEFSRQRIHIEQLQE